MNLSFLGRKEKTGKWHRERSNWIFFLLKRENYLFFLMQVLISWSPTATEFENYSCGFN